MSKSPLSEGQNQSSEESVVMAVPPKAELVGSVSAREHEMFSKPEAPPWWLVAFPKFEKALQLLKKTRKYIDTDWAKLDRDLEVLIFHRLAGIGPPKGFTRVVYGPHFAAVKGANRQRRNTLGGISALNPVNSHQNYSRRERALMAKRPKPDRCEICERQHPKIVWDHCHASGRFRGWICQDCNAALGFAADSPDRLRKLAIYIEQHTPPVPSTKLGPLSDDELKQLGYL